MEPFSPERASLKKNKEEEEEITPKNKKKNLSKKIIL